MRLGLKATLKSRINIGITLGDPLGIGPEVVAKALRDPHLTKQANFVLYGASVGAPLAAPQGEASLAPTRRFTTKQAGQIAIEAIRQATEAALAGSIDAIVTAPIHKVHARMAGFRYPGHTEYLAALTQTQLFRMMFVGPTLRVSLVTIHEPLRAVPKLLTIQNIYETINLTHRDLQRLFKIRRPLIAVAGLNPHAGDEGLFGSEEKTKILPAVRKAQAKKIQVQGPFSPDTIFRRAMQGEFDAIVAMYHDQGLIPLKLLHFDTAVNITLGLPIIRTSVDHGTALDIAGKGIADPTNMKAAIQMAIDLAKK